MACWNSADLCAARISVLLPDGSPDQDQVDGTAYLMSLISLAVTPTVDTGETVTVRNGCGDVCYTRTDADTATGADLVLTLCTYDIEFIGLAVSAEFFTANAQPGIAIGTTTADAVEAHFWTKSLDGSAQNAAPNSYWHHVYPNVTWTIGNYTFGRDNLQMVLNGTAGASSSIGNGAFNDIPAIVDPFFEAHWTADDIPNPDEAPYNENGLACGIINSPGASS